MAETSTTHAVIDALHEIWDELAPDQQLAKFRELSPEPAQEFFNELSSVEAAQLIQIMPASEQRLWIRVLAPDDAADVIQELPEDMRHQTLELLDLVTRYDVNGLLAYREDVAGGVMSPRFVRLRPEMTVAEAITYVRLQAQEEPETMYYIYVLDAGQHLLGAMSFRELFIAPGDKLVKDIMKTNLVTTDEQADQEALSLKFKQEDLLAIPVVDAENCMKGIVTIDDIVDVVEEEATEDIQKMGGTEALDMPYLASSIGEMIKKRAGWLTALFLSEMLTTTAMGYYQGEIARAVVLALFVPLVISSGGNSGSQASTLVIRAMALGEVRLRDWFRVFRREVISGFSLGLILGIIGFARVTIWEFLFHSYGEHYWLIGLTVCLSLILIVLWGSLSGALLPFLLRRLGFDPASASTPFVATLVDVTGLMIYFTVASFVLHGSLL
jgi:magnesium transporter